MHWRQIVELYWPMCAPVWAYGRLEREGQTPCDSQMRSRDSRNIHRLFSRFLHTDLHRMLRTDRPHGEEPP